MKFSTSTAVLSTLAASQLVTAGSHSRLFKHSHAARHASAAQEQKREVAHISKRDLANLAAWGIETVGLNPTTFNAGNPTAWIGTDGTYTNEIFNESKDDMILVVWGRDASWVNAHQPQITISIPANTSKVLSFNDNMTGGMAPVWGPLDMAKSYGQIAETWLEFTFSGRDSTVDVSREVNMKGSNIRVVTPTCTSDMNTCVFKCTDENAPSCWLDYKLVNCDPSQPGQSGAANGQDPGLNYAPSGGCQGIVAGTPLKTYMGYSDTTPNDHAIATKSL